jgi:hypothetical protein
MEAFKNLRANNDNEKFSVGDWVTMKRPQDTRIIANSLKTKPPFVIGKINEHSISLIARESRPERTGKPVHIELRVSKMTGHETPSYGVSADSIERFNKPEVIKN